MSLFFSSPWFLTGLLTVLIPVLLLLIKAKTRERVVFSSVLFFKAITLTSNRRLEWKRLILFALRVLALALLAFAFARPFQLGYENRAVEPVKQLTFVLDRSASMKMSESGRTSWDRAKEAIRAEVKRYGNAVYSMVVFDRKMSAAVLHEKSQRRFLDQLENLQPGDSASDFDMLHRNLRSVCGDQAERGRCVVLSDFLTDQGTLEALVQGGKEPSQASAPMQWVSVRPQSVRNFFIRKLLLPPRPFM
nr:VWA domain-containing protein [Candidatus Omnitrophota bacterium]